MKQTLQNRINQNAMINTELKSTYKNSNIFYKKLNIWLQQTSQILPRLIISP